MQLPAEFLVPMTTNANVVSSPDSTQGGSEDPAGLVFADLLPPLSKELPSDTGRDTTLPVVGMPLPLAGNILPPAGDPMPTQGAVTGMPVADGAPQPAHLTDIPPDADALTIAQNGRNFERLALPVDQSDILYAGNGGQTPGTTTGDRLDRGQGRPDIDGMGPVEGRAIQPALPVPAKLESVVLSPDSPLPAVAKPERVVPSPVSTLPDVLSNAASVRSQQDLQATPSPATPRTGLFSERQVSPVSASALPDLLRNAAAVSTPAQIPADDARAPATRMPMPASAIGAKDAPAKPLLPWQRAAFFTEPQVSRLPASPPPLAETGNLMSRQQNPLGGIEAPLIQELVNRRSSDGNAVKRSPPPQFGIESSLETRSSKVNSTLQDVFALQLQTETPVPKLSTSITLPPAHAAFISPSPGNIQSVNPVSAAVPVTSIETPVLDPAWAAAVHDRVVWMGGKGIQSAEIRLHPAELGPLHVQVAVDDDAVTVAFTASHAATRDALENALPRLKEMLAENGLSLAGASVSDEGVANQRDDSTEGKPAGNDTAIEESALAVSELLPGKPATRAQVGLVDTYV